MPMATPEARSRGISFFIFANGIFCLVISKNTEINRTAKTARYNANSPEETGIFLTKMPKVPKILMEAISIQRGLTVFLIWIPLNLPAKDL